MIPRRSNAIGWLLGAAACVAASACSPSRGVSTLPSLPGQRSGLSHDRADPIVGAAIEESAAAEAKTPGRCSPLEVRWPELAAEDLAAPVPGIVDDADRGLEGLYRKLALLMRGRLDDHVRIGFYGDSNMTMDLLSGSMRRTLQKAFGDAGHGYVSVGIPWRHYRHRDVVHGLDKTAWLEWAISTRKVQDGCYGVGGIASESVQRGAKAWVRTAPEGSPIGMSASRVEIHYLRRPGWGSFGVSVDGRRVAQVHTDAAEYGAGVHRLELEDGPHAIELTTLDRRKVRLFGVALERSQPGIVVDSLGIGGVSAHALSLAHPVVTRGSLANRRYDLVLFLLGTNTVNVSTQDEEMAAVIQAHRDALPGISILLMSPPDHVLSFEDPRTDPMTIRVGKQMRGIASRHGAAFWDFWSAMGGEGSMLEFQRRHWNQWDLYHLNERGASHMATRLLHALWGGFATWAKAHPDAGCDTEPGAGP